MIDTIHFAGGIAALILVGSATIGTVGAVAYAIWHETGGFVRYVALIYFGLFVFVVIAALIK